MVSSISHAFSFEGQTRWISENQLITKFKLKMKKIIRPIQFFAAMLLLGCSFTMVSCDNDDENAPVIPEEVTTDVIYGDYAGKMTVFSVNPNENEDSGEEDNDTTGVDISASVKNDTVYFEDYPIKDIVLSIVKDEDTANKIVEAVGKVNYKIGYEPKFTSTKDSIICDLEPESLKLSVTIPSSTEEEPQALQIEVKIETNNNAMYAIENGNMKFDIFATEVLLGEGEEQIPLEGFKPIGMNINMTQKK